MKKCFKILAAVFAAVLTVAPAAACGSKPNRLVVYMPDGAPALGMAKLMDEGMMLGGRDTEYRVVSANAIGGVIAAKTADVALIPVTAAGTAEQSGYKMLSVETHGNVYLIGFGEEKSVADFTGKKIGVMQLANVPGLTLKAILKEENLAYAPSAVAETAAQDKINLVPLADAPAQPLLSGAISALVVPEPALATILKTCEEKNKIVKVNFALHDLYKEAFATAQAYPQAVLVAKSGLATRAFRDEILAKLAGNGAWVRANPQAALDAVKGHLPADTAPSFTSLSADIYDRCNIYSVKAAEAKENVKTYLNAINALNPDDPTLAFKVPADAFFYAE